MHSSRFPKLELKYCERCGGLWVRPQGGQEVYCGKCTNAILELPPVKVASRKRGPAKPSAPPRGTIEAASAGGGARV